MKLRTLALCMSILALAAIAFADDAKSTMKPGNWSITVQMIMPGMDMPPVTVTRCITQAEADHPDPPADTSAEGCTISDYKFNSNTLTWKMKCDKQGVTGEGKITFSPESYTGDGHMKAGDVDMTQKFSGKYLGACDK
jgi:hypothetical protein